jgi:hypothetical protein
MLRPHSEATVPPTCTVAQTAEGVLYADAGAVSCRDLRCKDSVRQGSTVLSANGVSATLKKPP